MVNDTTEEMLEIEDLQKTPSSSTLKESLFPRIILRGRACLTEGGQLAIIQQREGRAVHAAD